MASYKLIVNTCYRSGIDGVILHALIIHHERALSVMTEVGATFERRRKPAWGIHPDLTRDTVTTGWRKPEITMTTACRSSPGVILVDHRYGPFINGVN